MSAKDKPAKTQRVEDAGGRSDEETPVTHTSEEVLFRRLDAARLAAELSLGLVPGDPADELASQLVH